MRRTPARDASGPGPAPGQPAADVPTAATAVGKPSAKRRAPSVRPARLAVVASAVAALTVIGAGLVRVPLDTKDTAAATTAKTNRGDKAGPGSMAKTVKVKRPVRYVRLKPGQKAPKGAKVIREAAPTPRIVIQRVPAPAATRATRKVVTRTRQSG